jgi:hypothetical protein
MKSAATLYHHYAGASLSLYVPYPTGGEAKLHPFLANILQQCAMHSLEATKADM